MPKTKRRSRARKIQRRRPRATTHAIVKRDVVTPTVIQRSRERELTQSEIDLVHRTVARGTDQDQFALFLWFCRKHGLDPVAKEVYCLLFNNAKHHQDFDCPGPPHCTQPQGNIGAYHSGKDMVILTGIGGLRGLAARNHPREYGSTDEPVFTWFEPQQFTPSPARKKIPETCSVSVWKRGDVRPTTATLYWEEFAPVDLTSDKAKFWRNSPKNQIAKCTEAQALKKAYPDLANIYVTEELARKESERTPEGREITITPGNVGAPTPGTHEAAQDVAKKQIEAYLGQTYPTLEVATEAYRKRKQEERGNPIPQGATPRQATPQQQKPQTAQQPASSGDRPQLTLDWQVSEVSPRLVGDSEIIEKLKGDIHASWGKDEFWHVEARDAETLRRCQDRFGYRLVEVLPKQPSTPQGGSRPTANAGASHGQGTGGGGEKRSRASRGSAPAVAWITGVVEQFSEKMSKGQKGDEKKGIKPRPSKPYLSVLIKSGGKSQWYSLWDKELFHYINRGKITKSGEFIVSQSGNFWNLVGFRTLEGIQFDDDGKTESIQQSTREAGTPTLWRNDR